MQCHFTWVLCRWKADWNSILNLRDWKTLDVEIISGKLCSFWRQPLGTIQACGVQLLVEFVWIVVCLKLSNYKHFMCANWKRVKIWHLFIVWHWLSEFLNYEPPPWRGEKLISVDSNIESESHLLEIQNVVAGCGISKNGQYGRMSVFGQFFVYAQHINEGWFFSWTLHQVLILDSGSQDLIYKYWLCCNLLEVEHWMSPDVLWWWMYLHFVGRIQPTVTVTSSWRALNGTRKDCT